MSHPSDTILIVDDEERLVACFEELLHEHGITNTVTCSDSREARRLIETQPFGIILLDLDMPFITGLELLAVIGEHLPDAVSLVITGAADVDSAVNCMRKGASDYLVKPIDANRLVASVQNAIDIFDLRRQNTRLKRHFLQQGVENPDAFTEIVTRNSGMQTVLRYVEAVAESNQCVLITGETGSGKELIARAVHTVSGRKGDFVAVNVAGLDDVMFSDTLFGHVKGAYTGADGKRAGMVDAATGGTLFLDEIGDLSPGAQVKLLRLLQEQEYLPLGSDNVQKADTRIVAATNKSVQALKTGATMRTDLYYRLAVHSVRIPPLRDRLDDIPLLLNHFIAEAANDMNRDIPDADDTAVRALQRYAFPGNIRELEAMVRDTVSTLHGDTITAEAFEAHLSPASDPQEAANSLTAMPPLTDAGAIIFPESLPTTEEALQSLILETMRRHKNNQTLAAKSLGISRQTLNKKWGCIRDPEADAQT
ncbi:MAG: DNA-binding NtrC family response regulator [Candidatus Promineifilaceae bacterium]|jgi:DNA-binding NtrC family response regulator